LVTEVGEDFFRSSHNLTCSYADHLKDAGISVVPLVVSFPRNEEGLGSMAKYEKLLQKYGNDLLRSGILKVSGKRTAFVISLSDHAGQDIFFFDDSQNASEIAEFRPAPTELLDELDSIIVSSGNNSFNQLVVEAAYEKGLDVFFDVGLFEPSSDYLRNVVMKSTIVFGNTKEISEVCKAFGFLPDQPERIFSSVKPARLEYIVLVEKEVGKATILGKDNPKPVTIGPLKYRKTGTSVGVCDAITGGTIALFSQGYPIETSCRGGLIAGGAVWESDKIQEPMVDWRALSDRYKALFGGPLKRHCG
jgi:sugar/nucleoside kinase (ribokinase family)